MVIKIKLIDVPILPLYLIKLSIYYYKFTKVDRWPYKSIANPNKGVIKPENNHIIITNFYANKSPSSKLINHFYNKNSYAYPAKNNTDVDAKV